MMNLIGTYVSSFDNTEHMTQQDMASHDAELILQETLNLDSNDLSQYELSQALLNSYDSIIDENDEENLESFSEHFSELLTFPTNSSELLFDHHHHQIMSDDTPSVISSDLTQTMIFSCPKCGRKFTGSWKSCEQHIQSRKHGTSCHYDTQWLPSCLSSHSLLPIDPHSGWCDLQGRRKYIEDAHAVVFTNDYKFFGVFDGHFGNRAANYASKHIQLLFEEYYSGKYDNNHSINNFKDKDNTNNDNFHSILTSINASQEWKDLYLLTPQEMNTIISQNSHNMNENEIKNEKTINDLIHYLQLSFIQTNDDFLQINSEDLSGTTATVSILLSNYILVGNIGDSRAVLCCDKDGTAIQLTTDHTPYNSQEKDRIISLGGYVNTNITKNDILRVNNILAVSRSIGDPNLRHVLSSEPDLILFRRFTSTSCSTSQFSYLENSSEIDSNSDNSCQKISKLLQLSSNNHNISQLFLVLGSDGLWDVMNNQQVIEYICDALLSLIMDYYMEYGIYQLPFNAYQNVARDISREAYVRGSMDNIGVCIIDLTV